MFIFIRGCNENTRTSCRKKFLELHLYLLLDKEISKQCRLRLFKGWITLSHWINPYPVDSAVRFIHTSLLVSDLFVGQRYLSFEQVSPEKSLYLEGVFLFDHVFRLNVSISSA